MRSWLPILSLLGACSSTGVPIPEYLTLSDDIDASSTAWANSGISNYRFTYDIDTWPCGSPELIAIVEDHEPVSLVYGESFSNCGSTKVKGHSAAADLPNYPRSMSDLFNYIESCTNPDDVEAKFHPTLGFPIRIRCDASIEDGNEMFIITSFKITESDV